MFGTRFPLHNKRLAVLTLLVTLLFLLAACGGAAQDQTSEEPQQPVEVDAPESEAAEEPAVEAAS